MGLPGEERIAFLLALEVVVPAFPGGLFVDFAEEAFLILVIGVGPLVEGDVKEEEVGRLVVLQFLIEFGLLVPNVIVDVGTRLDDEGAGIDEVDPPDKRPIRVFQLNCVVGGPAVTRLSMKSGE